MNKIIAIDFQYCWLIFRQKIGWIFLFSLIGSIVGFAGAYWSPYWMPEWALDMGLEVVEDSYRAVATVYSFEEGATDETLIGLNTLQTYAETIKSRTIADKARELLGNTELTIDDIYGMLSTDSRYIMTSTTRYTNESIVVPVYAESNDQTLSISVANAAADAFVEEINRLLGSDIVQVLDYANGTERTKNANVYCIIFSVIGTLAGAFFTTLFFSLRVILSPRVNTMSDISLYGQIPVLGILPGNKK